MSFGKFTFDGSFGAHTNTLIDYYTLQGHGPSIEQVAFSPKGKLLAWVSSDRTVTLWSVEECISKHILKIPGLGDPIIILRDSTLVVCEEFSGLVRVWDTGTGEVKNEMQLKLADYTGLECSSDGSLVAAALEVGSIELRDTEKREIKHVFPRTLNVALHSIKLSSNGEVMAVVHSHGCTILRNTGKEFQGRMFSDLPSWDVYLLFSPNNQVMAVVTQRGIFLIWDEAWFGDKHGQAPKRISGYPQNSSSRIVFFRGTASWRRLLYRIMRLDFIIRDKRRRCVSSRATRLMLPAWLFRRFLHCWRQRHRIIR